MARGIDIALDHGGGEVAVGMADIVAHAVAPVGERPGPGAEHHGREEIGEGDEAEPSAGMGQLPGEPADGDALQPSADQRDRIAGGEEPAVPADEGAGDVAKAAHELSSHAG